MVITSQRDILLFLSNNNLLGVEAVHLFCQNYIGRNMTVESPQLPPECKGHILSFLPLRDVLCVASTSKSALRESLPDLYRRREYLKLDLAYCPNSGQRTHSSRVSHFGTWQVMTARHPDVDWRRIPSVYVRVCDLHKHIPSGHPMVNTIGHLKDDLASTVSTDSFAETPLSFTHIFHVYRKLLHSQKLLAATLRHVIHSNPTEKNSTVNLDLYMGDVLCVAYLMFNQSSLDGVHGWSSNHSAMYDVRQFAAKKSCYLSWVYLHSSILRTKKFSVTQRRRLGVPEFAGLSEMVLNDDHYVSDSFLASEMTLVYREFGPLGPAFRGRDIVRFREIPARGLFAYMIGSTIGDVAGEAALHA